MFLITTPVSAGSYINTYYKDDVVEEISKGVTHISSTRLTNKGVVKEENVKLSFPQKLFKNVQVFNDYHNISNEEKNYQ